MRYAGAVFGRVRTRRFARLLQGVEGDGKRMTYPLDKSLFFPGEEKEEKKEEERKTARKTAKKKAKKARKSKRAKMSPREALRARMGSALGPLCARVGKALTHLGLLCDGRVFHTAVVIACAEGATAQALHTDVPNLWNSLGKSGEAPCWGYDEGPLSALFALGPDTRIRVWKGSHLSVWNMLRGDAAPPDVAAEWEDIRIPKGSLCLFSGALVHAGAGYSEDHCSIHFYINSAEVAIGNSTGAIKNMHNWKLFFKPAE